MLSLRRRNSPLDEIVRSLPEGFHALSFGGAQVVVGPTGAFALADAGPDADESARLVVRAAREVRERLVEALAWAPFVDALVVADHATGRPAEAPVVPRRIVRSVLTAGRPRLDRPEIARIVATLA